jgi:hypothetical protein
MKLTKFFLYFTVVAIFFTSCDTEVKLTGVTLDESSISVAIKDTAELVATVQPKGAIGTVVWSSSNPTIAKVENGKVIGVSLGKANIVASVGTFSASCEVTVTKEVVDFKSSLMGTEYYIVSMDGVTATKLGTKVKSDFRPDELIKFLYIWDNTFVAGTSSGPNAFGEVEPWVALSVGTVGWSGAGFNVKDGAALDKLAAITANPDKYYLHIGIKSKSAATFVIGMDGQSNVKFAIGPNAFNDNGTIIQPLADFPRDGEWQKIEIPMSTLKTKGLLYSTGMGEKNVFWFLAGGVAGTELNFDGVFIYKKP